MKEKTKEFLSGKSVEDKIAHLQDARYELEQESNAYREELKYAKILDSKNRLADKNDLTDRNKTCLFPEKIKLLKDMIYELISKERQKLREKIEMKNILLQKNLLHV